MVAVNKLTSGTSVNTASSGEPSVAREKTKGERRREQIVGTAKEILLSQGYEKLGMRELAKQIGIKHGNLQYYFPTKNDLLIAIFDDQLSKYTSSLKDAVAATSTKQGRIGAIVDAAFEEMRNPDTALWRLLISLADHTPELAAILRKENELYQKEVAEQLKVIAPELSASRRQHVAQMFNAFLDGFGVQGAYKDLSGPDMKALAAETKVALVAIIDMN